MSEADDTHQHDPIYLKPFAKDRAAQMIANGVPAQDLIPRGTKIDVVDFLVSMEPNIPGVNNKPISTKKQVDSLRRILKNPLRHPYLIGISSFPSDNRAKYLAQTIMSAAYDQYDKDRRAMGLRSRPMWHRVYGNLRDSLRDGPKEKPAMLVISNLNDEASSTKIEKVRDLLEMYNDIPRIVVAGGAPIIDLFSYRLSMALNAGFYVGPQNLIQESL